MIPIVDLLPTKYRYREGKKNQRNPSTETHHTHYQ
jgi:hypothetical protein